MKKISLSDAQDLLLATETQLNDGTFMSLDPSVRTARKEALAGLIAGATSSVEAQQLETLLNRMNAAELLPKSEPGQMNSAIRKRLIEAGEVYDKTHRDAQ